MSDQLKVDLGRLVELSGTLSKLSAELSDTPNHLDEYRTAMGDPALAQATQDLGEDWTSFRQRLIADIGILGTFADTAAKHYSGVDSDLATAITGLMPPPLSPHVRARMD